MLNVHMGTETISAKCAFLLFPLKYYILSKLRLDVVELVVISQKLL